jgi:hypothetical protein
LNAQTIEAALYPDLERYVAFGPKRTASAADHAVSRWLAQEAASMGAAVQVQPFRVRQFDLQEAALSVAGVSFETLPFWFPRPTQGVIEARLRPLEEVGEGQIAVADLPSGIDGLRAMPAAVAAAARRHAAGLILVTPTPSGHLFAHGQREACATPTLVVGVRDRIALVQGAAEGLVARLTLRGEILPEAESVNVIATMGQGERVIGVSTPTSAWLTSGGERGPGVALWLALLRRAAQTTGVRWIFAAVSGHELDAAGGRAFVASPLAPATVMAWCHLGASIATRRFTFGPAFEPIAHEDASGAARLMTNDDALREVLTESFASSAHRPRLAEATESRGELRLYMERGYPTFGFEGAHAYFHTPADLAQTTSPALLSDVYGRLDRTFAALGV